MYTKNDQLVKCSQIMESIRIAAVNGIIARDFRILNDRQCVFSINEVKIESYFFDYMSNPIEIHLLENETKFGIIKIAFDSNNQTYLECIDNRNIFKISSDFFPEVLKLHGWNKQNTSK